MKIKLQLSYYMQYLPDKAMVLSFIWMVCFFWIAGRDAQWFLGGLELWGIPTEPHSWCLQELFFLLSFQGGDDPPLLLSLCPWLGEFSTGRGMEQPSHSAAHHHHQLLLWCPSTDGNAGDFYLFTNKHAAHIRFQVRDAVFHPQGQQWPRQIKLLSIIFNVHLKKRQIKNQFVYTNKT